MAADSLLAEVSTFVRKHLRTLLLHRLYPGKIVAQATTGGPVDVATDDVEVLGPSGFSGVPLLVALPGMKVRAVGARVRILWDAADPSRPRAALFEQGGPVDEIVFDDGTKAVARVDDTTQLKLRFNPGSGGATLEFSTDGAIWTPVSPAGTDCVGKITSGASKLKA